MTTPLAFLLDPNGRRIKGLDHAPNDRSDTTAALNLYTFAPLEVRELRADVAGYPNGNHTDPRPGSLVLVSGQPKAAYENEADVYFIGGHPAIGRALLAVREAGAPPLGASPIDRTGFLRVELSDAELGELIDWERPVKPAEAADAPLYDVDALETYLRMIGEAADKVLPTGGSLRLHLVDAFGEEAGAMNFLPTDWRGARRYALDAFDQRLNVLHELIVRNTAPAGGAGEQMPLAPWATSAKESDADLAIDAGGAKRYLKIIAAPWKRPDAKLAKAKHERIPLPGIATWQAGHDPRVTAWQRVS